MKINIKNVKNKKVEPFDSFSAVYKTLCWTGYYKPLQEIQGRYRRICYQIYRVFAFLLPMLYSLMHLVFTWQHRDQMDEVLENVIIEIPQFNLLVKILAFNLQSDRIDKLNKLLHDPIFAANCLKDEEYLTKDKIEMHRLSRLINIGVSITTFCWPISFLVKRLNDQNTVISAYVPFETTSWIGFSWSLVLEVVPILWIGYGHFAFDCVAATYYSQIHAQLKIIKYNLEQLFENDFVGDDNEPAYIDIIDRNLQHRFTYYVKRYDRLMWYSKEVNTLFNFSITVQIITSSTILCALIYKMSNERVLSAPFLFHSLVFILLLTQVFLYCYYGNFVSHESQLINRSVSMSDWSAVSPSFRKLLLIAMTRWSIPIVPKVCGVIPLSMHTFITIVKSSYTLYTILLTKQK